MNILILNGSPKGKYSITLQTTNYLMQKYPDEKIEVLNVGQKIRTFEKDFSSAAESFHCALSASPFHRTDEGIGN